MFDYIKNKLDFLLNFILESKYFFIYLPLFLWLLGFVEVSTPLWTFLPMEIISITSFAFSIHDTYLFWLNFLTFFFWIFFWMLFWYYLGKKFCNWFVCKLWNKYKNVEKYFKEIEVYIHKYNLLAIPLLINLWLIRPFVAMYLWSRNYDFKKFVLGSFIASFTYVVFRAAIGYLFWIFGKIIFDYLEIWYRYVLYVLVGLIILSFIADFFIAKKETEK